MTVKIDGTNTVANPAFTGADTDTGLQCGTNEVKLVTGGTARVTVDSSGNLGLGTTSPNDQSSAGYTSLTLNNASSGSILDLRHNDTALSGGRMVGSANEFGLEARSQNAGSQISFYVNNAYAGRFTVNGLCFGNDTAAANALDDYEEGDFVPTYGSGITSPSYTGTGGHYTKIGNLVTFTIRIRATGTNSSSHLKIAGLPFASNDRNEGSVSFGYRDNLNGSTGFTGHIPENSSEIHFYQNTGSNLNGNSGNGITGRTLHLRGFYYTNS